MKKYFLSFLTIQLTLINSIHAQDVNDFNGSLNYGVPLLSLPSDRGNAIPFNLSYGGNGIGVMQPASEVGLGWGAAFGGSIIRTVSGIPDDFNGLMFDQKSKQFVNQRGILSTQGPTSFDVFTSKRNLDSNEFHFPNYDKYSVNAPGMGGNITPLLLNYLAFSRDANGGFNYDAATSFDPMSNRTTINPAKFMFTGDFADTLVSRHFPTSPVTSSTPFKMPKNVITGDCYNDNRPYFGKRGDGTGTNCEENYNITSNRLATSNYVEYTMNELGISSFKITNTAGFVYRFDLPVYTNSSTNYSYPLNNDYSIPSSILNYKDDDIVTQSGHHYVEHRFPNDGGEYITEVKEVNKIPVEWKLTSITGPDYVDSNSNGIVDENDAGYWILFDYKLWTSHFYTRYPAYGFNYFFGNDEATKNYAIDDVKKRSGKLATASFQDDELYYLNSIKSSSHSVLIIRDIRYDEVAANPYYDVDSAAYSTNKKRIPQLLIKRVLLVNNSVLSNSVFSNITPFTAPNSNFELSGTTYNQAGKGFTEAWYQANSTYLNSVTLKANVFEYDYSLANNYHRNINVQENNTYRLTTPAAVQNSLTVTSYSLGTGKLCLKKVISIELGGTQLYPSIKFDYNASDNSDNPNFDPRKVDYWGYYKSDISSLGYYGYTSNTSKDFTDAWMLRKITNPYGGITELVYESNAYEKVLKGNGGLRHPSRLYPISTISTTDPGTTPTLIYLEEGTNLTNDLSAVYNATASSTYSVDVFIPMVQTLGDPLAYVTPLKNYFGTLTYTYNTSQPLPIRPLSIEKNSEATVGLPFFRTCSGPDINLNTYNLFDPSQFKYTGNGWIRFIMPVSKDPIFGAGVRVRKIIQRNGTKDAYETLYEYEKGVVLAEADRFSNPVYRYTNKSTCSIPEKLSPFGSDRYDLNPMIGYSKTTVKELGQTNTAKGKIVTTYITNDDFSNEFYTTTPVENYKPYLSNKSVFTSSTQISFQNCSRQDTGFVVEYVDKFSPYWGLVSEQIAYDVNDNILNKSVYEYESTTQGAIVENFVFALKKEPYVWNGQGTPAPCNQFNAEITLYQTSIKRTYPVVLKRSINHGINIRSIKETVKRDEVTGESLIVKSTGINNSSSLIIKTPSFRLSQFSSMGAKSINPAYTNQLGAEAYYYSVTDSLITGTPNQASTNFSGAIASVYTNTCLIRGLNTTNNTYTNSIVSKPNWMQKSSYSWTGNTDIYGLFNKTSLSSNPFNYSNPSASNSQWRLNAETSLMNQKGHVLETRSFTNRFTATKLDYNSKYLIAQITNCNYKSFTFSGFESFNLTYDAAEGEVRIPDNTTIVNAPGTVTFTAHSGKQVAQLSGTDVGPGYYVAYEGTGANGEELGLLRGRIYRASVWVHANSTGNPVLVLTVDGSVNNGNTYFFKESKMTMADAKALPIGNWKRLTVDVKVPDDYLSVNGSTNKLSAYVVLENNGTAWLDDFQLHPIESEVGHKVYNQENGQIMAEIDADGFAIKYEYDQAGRVTAVYKEIPGSGLKLIKTNAYNFGRGLD